MNKGKPRDYRRTAQSPRGGVKALFFAGLLIAVVAPWNSIAFGQSYLEKLEALVERVQQPPNTGTPATAQSPDKRSDSNTGDLPAPKVGSSSGSTAPPADSSSPATASPNQTASQSSSTSGDSQIYLGLEAEGAVGGGLGVRIANVTEQSPAWKAGLSVGDRILAINGFGIADLEDMAQQLSKTRPGENCEFLISRGGKTISKVAVLMDANLAAQIRGGTPPRDDELMEGNAWLGVEVNDLTPGFRQQFGIAVFRGAAVTGVADSSPAKKAGILPGDCIVEASGMPIGDARALIAWVQSARPGQLAELIVYRGGFSRTLQLVLENDPASGVPTTRGARPSNRPLLPQNTIVDGGPDNRLGPGAEGALEELSLPPSDTGPLLVPPASRPPAVNRRIDEMPVPPPSTAVRDSQSPEQISPRGAAPSGNGTGQTRIAELERQVSELTDELQSTKQQLEDAQLKLQRILDALGRQP